MTGSFVAIVPLKIVVPLGWEVGFEYFDDMKQVEYFAQVAVASAAVLLHSS